MYLERGRRSPLPPSEARENQGIFLRGIALGFESILPNGRASCDNSTTKGQGFMGDEQTERGSDSLPGGITPSQEQPASISLDDLRRAFADAMHIAQTDPSPPSSTEATAVPHADVIQITAASIIEALLFVGSPTNACVSLAFMKENLQGMSLPEIEKTIDELNDSYRHCGHPWHIVRDGEQCSMQLLESIELALERLQAAPKDTSLSQNAIDCLSLIAYQPGITKEELETQWRQNAGMTLSYLIKKGLVRSEDGKINAASRYFTTERFLEILGLQSLDDLPQGEEL